MCFDAIFSPCSVVDAMVGRFNNVQELIYCLGADALFLVLMQCSDVNAMIGCRHIIFGANTRTLHQHHI